MAGAKTGGVVRTLTLGFIAGVLGVLLFHQLMAWTISGRIPWSNWNAIRPFGVPGIVNTAFWGGVWGIVFALVADKFPRGIAWLFAAALFGAVCPTLVSWFVVPLIKGGTLGPRGVWYNGPLINGAWGLGTGISLYLLRRVTR